MLATQSVGGYILRSHIRSPGVLGGTGTGRANCVEEKRVGPTSGHRDNADVS